MERLLLNIPEVAHLLGISRAKVYMLIGEGRLPSVKLDRSRRVRREDLDTFVNQLEEAPKTEDA